MKKIFKIISYLLIFFIILQFGLNLAKEQSIKNDIKQHKSEIQKLDKELKELSEKEKKDKEYVLKKEKNNEITIINYNNLISGQSHKVYLIEKCLLKSQCKYFKNKAFTKDYFDIMVKYSKYKGKTMSYDIDDEFKTEIQNLDKKYSKDNRKYKDEETARKDVAYYLDKTKFVPLFLGIENKEKKEYILLSDEETYKLLKKEILNPDYRILNGNSFSFMKFYFNYLTSITFYSKTPIKDFQELLDSNIKKQKDLKFIETTLKINTDYVLNVFLLSQIDEYLIYKNLIQNEISDNDKKIILDITNKIKKINDFYIPLKKENDVKTLKFLKHLIYEKGIYNEKIRNNPFEYYKLLVKNDKLAQNKYNFYFKKYFLENYKNFIFDTYYDDIFPIKEIDKEKILLKYLNLKHNLEQGDIRIYTKEELEKFVKNNELYTIPKYTIKDKILSNIFGIDDVLSSNADIVITRLNITLNRNFVEMDLYLKEINKLLK